VVRGNVGSVVEVGHGRAFLRVRLDRVQCFRGNVEHDLVAVRGGVIAGFAVEKGLGDPGQGIGTAGMERLAARGFRGNLVRYVVGAIHGQFESLHDQGTLLGR